MPSTTKAINSNAAADVKLLPPPKLIDHPLTLQQTNGISRHINPKDARSFKTWPCLSPPGQQTLAKIPLHYIGAFRNWQLALSSIYSFNALTPPEQQNELDLSKNLPPHVKKLYRYNINYLYENRPSPLVSAPAYASPISQQRDGIQLKNLVALSAARARTVSPTIALSRHELLVSSAIKSTRIPQCPLKTKVVNLKNRTIKHELKKSCIDAGIKHKPPADNEKNHITPNTSPKKSRRDNTTTGKTITTTKKTCHVSTKTKEQLALQALKKKQYRQRKSEELAEQCRIAGYNVVYKPLADNLKAERNSNNGGLKPHQHKQPPHEYCRSFFIDNIFEIEPELLVRVTRLNDKLHLSPVNSQDGKQITIDSKKGNGPCANVNYPSTWVDYFGKEIQDDEGETISMVVEGSRYIQRAAYATGTGAGTKGICKT